MDDAGSYDFESRSAPDLEAPVAEAPLLAYRSALATSIGLRLYEIHQALGSPEPGAKPTALAGVIAEHLGEPRVAERLVAGLETGPRMVLSLFALTETTSWPMFGLSHALAALGVDPLHAVRALLGLGLLAARSDSHGEPVGDYARLLDPVEPRDALLFAHPAALAAARTVLPEGDWPPPSGPVQHIREADGLELILRLAAVWQRVEEGPLRQTQQGTLFKRDRERLEDDPVLAGPIADALEPLPDMVALWLGLARGVGLLVAEPSGERIVVARPEFWSENAIHLPQMIAVRWLSWREWHEQGGMRQEGSTIELALPYLRPAILLWLAALPEADWVTLEDLAEHLRGLSPDWGRPTFLGSPPPSATSPPARVRATRGQGAAGATSAEADVAVLRALLLGPAYQLGLVRGAESTPGGRRAVQLTSLGRYILALGPPPEPRPSFEQFLFVQPNFEMIAYRQGLNPMLIGQFSRFARWSQIGAALELKLTPETIYRGLEGGLTSGDILDRLTRHVSRPLPAGVAEALRTWAGRRERVTFHASATLIEFASSEDLERALALWPETDRVAPIRISERLLLVEDEAAIPFGRFRMTGSREYRRPPETCVEVEPDGVTLTLDLARSDLLVDAELIRFADEQAREPSQGPPGHPRRRFRVSAESVARALENGQGPAWLARWFEQRTGGEIPPAIGLLLHAANRPGPAFSTERRLVLQATTSALVDGLLQHPDTRSYLGERLGPTAVVVPDDLLPSLQRALERLGLATMDPSAAPKPVEDAPPSRRTQPG